MCKSKVFFVSFFAAIILGIGIGITTVSVQAARTKLPHTGNVPACFKPED